MRPRLLSGPDDAVRLWWRMTARESTASGRDPFLMKGRVAANECEACGHDRHHEVPAKKGRGWVDRCMRCGAPWKSGVGYVLRNQVKITTRPHGLEHRLVDLAELATCIEQIAPTDSMLYGLYLVTDRSYEFVAQLANTLAREKPAIWKPPPGGYTLAGVRWAVKRARRILRGALERRALLPREVPVLLLRGDREVLEALEPLPIEAVVPADPLRWEGLLHEFAVDAVGRLQAAITSTPLIRLSRGQVKQVGTVYREVPI